MVAMEKCEPKYEPRCRIFFAEGQKFRTNLLVLFFDLPLKRETATKTALLAEVLRQGEDPTGAARQAELLFGAHWDISVVKKGERQLLLFSLEALKNVETEEMLAFFARAVVCAVAEWLYGENRGAAEENSATEIGKPKG